MKLFRTEHGNWLSSAYKQKGDVMETFDYVLMIAEERNMTAAAARLFVTQPALTLRINRLENKLGFRIFDRTKSPVEITKEGEVYIQEMRKICYARQQLQKKLERMLRGDQNHLDLGVGITRGRIWLPSLLPYMQKKNPDLLIQVHEASDGIQEELLRNDEIDVGILGSAVVSQELSSIPLGSEKMFFAVPKDSPILAGMDISHNDEDHPCLIDAMKLNNQVFIHGSQPYGLTRYFNLISSLYHITPKFTLNVGNSETAYFLAGAGAGITLTLSFMHHYPLMKGDTARPVLCSIKDVPLTRTVLLAFKTNRSEDPLILWTARAIRQLFFPETTPME